MTAFDEILWTDPWQTGAGRAGIQVLSPGPELSADSGVANLTWRCWGKNSPGADSYVWYGLIQRTPGGNGSDWPANSSMTKIVAPAGTGAQSWIAAEWHLVVGVSFGATSTLYIYAGCQDSSNWDSEVYATVSGEITIPARPYHAPAAPGVWIDGANIYCNGHQLNPGADSYWAETWWGLEINDVWAAAVRQANNASSYAYAAAANSRYRGAASASNANAVGPSGYSGYWYTAPNAPANVQAFRAPGSTAVQLTWDPNGARYVGEYRVYRSLNGGPVSLYGTVNTPSFNDTVAVGSSASYFVVAATPWGVNQAVSANSNQATIGAGYNVPNPPSVAIVRTGVSTATVTIAGNQNTATNDRYTATLDWQIQVNGAAFAGGAWGLAGSTTSIPVTGLPADSQIRVQARFGNAAGESAWAQSGYLYTVPDAPSGFTAARANAGSSTVNLSWVNNAGYPANYLLEKLAGGVWTQVATFAGNAVAGTVQQGQAESASYRLRTVTSDNQYSGYSGEWAVGVAFVSNKNNLRVGGSPLSRCYVGGTRIRRIAKGGTVIWEDGDA